MICRIFAVLVAICAIALLGRSPESAGQEKTEAPAVLLSPKDGEKVTQSEDIEGQVKGQGWPVVLVKPLAGNQPWWVQDPVQEMEKGKFSASVQFGDEKTEAGTKFRIIIVVAKNKEAAHKIKAGKRDSLPPGLPKSEAVTVSRK